jgi:hypothetical protein
MAESRQFHESWGLAVFIIVVIASGAKQSLFFFGFPLSPCSFRLP